LKPNDIPLLLASLVPKLKLLDVFVDFSSTAEAFSSYPGRTVSHATHLSVFPLFLIIQDSHFHESLSTVNMLPHPLPVVFESTALAGALLSCAPLSSSSSEKSDSSSPFPNNHPKYQVTNACSPIFPFSSLIFLIVRRCSSSQYVVPNSSISLTKLDLGISPDVVIEWKALVAFAFSSSLSSRSSVSIELPSFSPSSIRSQYH